MSSSLIAGGATADADDDGVNATDEAGDCRLVMAVARAADVDVEVEVDLDAVDTVITAADIDVGADDAVVAAAEDDGTAARPAECCRSTPEGGLL